jgi:hypothetical protein
MVKFGKGGKTSYYTEPTDLMVTGSSGMVIRGNLPKGIADAIKTGKFGYEVPVKGNQVKFTDPSGAGKEYAVPLQSYLKQGTGEHIGFKVSEKTGIARKADEPPFYRAYSKEVIVDTPTIPKSQKIKYDLNGKVIKETKPDINTNTLKDLYGKTSGTSKKDVIDTSTSKGGQTLTSPVKTAGKGEKLKIIAKEQARIDIKKSPYSSAITGSAVITSTKSLAITSTRIDSGVRIQEKISTKTQTGLKQDQGLVQDTVVKQQMKSKSGLKSKMNIRLDTGMKLQQKQKYAVKMTIPLKTPLRSSRPKVGGFVWIPEGKAQETTLKRKRGKKAGFIGNVRLDNITGMYKRKEITYGAKKVTKLERQDARLTSGTSNRIAQPASGLLKTKKKKKEKKTSVFGGGKDEFKGFGSKKKGKKTSLFG